jgi:murein L,D-transpeptidase YafK
MWLTLPVLAGEKVDLVSVHKTERRLELIGDGKVLRSYDIALGDEAAVKARNVDAGGMIMIHGQSHG